MRGNVCHGGRTAFYVVAHMSPCLMAIPLELFALSLIYPLFQVFKSKNTATKLFSCGFIRVRNQLHGSSKILKARWRRGSLLLHKIADTLFCIVQLIFAYLLYSLQSQTAVSLMIYLRNRYAIFFKFPLVKQHNKLYLKIF